MNWVAMHWMEALSIALLAIGVWWLMPRAAQRSKAVGLVLAVLGAGLLATRIEDGSGPVGETILFWVFAAAAVISAVLMITNRNPVYSALWFAMVTLNVCALFLLQFAPFLAAATVIVYAGAIVVTFVFVIMLAQQSGATVYDQRSRQPIVATLAAFALLATILAALPNFGAQAETEGAELDAEVLVVPAEEPAGPVIVTAEPPPAPAPDVVANPLSRPLPGEPLNRMHALGRALFGDYLYAIELAGTLLLVATIGAIAIAPRRRRGTL